jgi:hypothetical protein
MEYFGILLRWVTSCHEGNTSVFDVDTSSHVVRCEFIEVYSESAGAEFISLGADRDNQYCTVFYEPRLSVSGTDSMKFLMFGTAYL